MVEDIIKIHNFNNASSVESRRGNSTMPQVKAIDKTADAEIQKQHDNKSVEKAIDTISNFAKFYNRKIRIELEKDLNLIIVKVIDGDTEQVIRQIPSEEIVELSRHAKDQKGLLIDKEG